MFQRERRVVVVVVVVVVVYDVQLTFIPLPICNVSIQNGAYTHA
jgi:hypothetical protein